MSEEEIRSTKEVRVDVDAIDPELIAQATDTRGRSVDCVNSSNKPIYGLGSLTLTDIESIASRLGAAAKTIRDAMALLGGGLPGAAVNLAPPPSHAGPSTASAQVDDADAIRAHLARQRQPPDNTVPRELRMTRRPVDPNLPPEIAAMETT